MQRVRSRLGDGVDHRSRSPAIIRRVIRSNDVELLHRIHTQAGAENAARCAVGVVVDVNAVDPVSIFIRTMTAVGELITEAAIAAIRRASGGILRSCRKPC